MATTPLQRVEVTPKSFAGLKDTRGESIRRQLASDHGLQVKEVRSIIGYLVKADLAIEQQQQMVTDLFCDPVIEHGSVNESMLNNQELFSERPDVVIQIGFKPGVTDNAAQAGLDGLKTLFPVDANDAAISTTMTYIFYGLSTDIDCDWLATQLHNQMIERVAITNFEDSTSSNWKYLDFPEPTPNQFSTPSIIDLEVSDNELVNISETGLLALNLEEMQAIQAHYRDPEVRESREKENLHPNAPTDVELECLAQTWSEHCKHKIFSANIHHVDNETGEDTHIDSLFKTHIMKPTFDIAEKVDWLLSGVPNGVYASKQKHIIHPAHLIHMAAQ